MAACPQVCALARALGVLRYDDPSGLLSLVWAACASRLDSLSVRELADLAWGLAVAGFREPAAFEHLATAVTGKLAGLSPTTAPRVLWALAVAQGRGADAVLMERLGHICFRSLKVVTLLPV